MSGNGAGRWRDVVCWLDFQEEVLLGECGGESIEVGIEREEDGRIKPASRARVIESVRGVFRQGPIGGVAVCAVGARGVTLRRVKLPAASVEETRRLIRLQLERELPLSPDELAWGYCRIGEGGVDEAVGMRGQEYMVAAVKRMVVEDYVGLVRECGLRGVMVLGAWARSYLLAAERGRCALLEVGRKHAELSVLDGGVLESVRVLKGEWQAGEDGWQSLAEMVRARCEGRQIYLSGLVEDRAGMIASFERVMGSGRWVPLRAGEGGNRTTVRGMQRAWELHGEALPLVLKTESEKPGKVARSDNRWKWATVAAVILVGLVTVRYAEAVLLHGRLSGRLSAVRAYQESLPRVEGELSFLQYLKTNQAPYLEAISAMAESAPQGTRIETMSMNRRGEWSMRTSVPNPQLVAEFRSKLVKSGLFQSVALEEQAPAANQQGVSARFSGRWETSTKAP